MAEQNPTPNTAPLPAQAGTEIGDSGTLIYKGYITNEEYNAELRGVRALQTYDIMRRSDATVHAVLIVVKNPIIGADHDIEPGGDDDIDIEIADFTKRELMQRNLTWTDIVRQALTALDMGHSVFEKVYELTDFNGKPRIGIKKLATRKQRSIQAWAMKNGEPGIQQQINNVGTKKPDLVDIPREKLIYVTNEREGDNYDGISLLRFAYKPWKIKDALELMNAVALERMSIGIPKLMKNGTISQVSEPELVKARESLRQMRANEEAYIELPEGLDVEMLDLKANSTKEVLPSIEHQNTQITLSALSQFLMLGSGESSAGSRAVSSDQTTMFNKALEAVARTIQQAFQDDLIKPLVDLNYTDVKNYPKYVINGIADDDIAIVSKAVSDLMNAGAVTADADVENRLRQMLGLPEMSKEDYDSYEEKHQKPDMNIGDEPSGTPSKDAPKDTKKSAPDLEKTKKDKQNASLLADAREAKRHLVNQLLEV